MPEITYRLSTALADRYRIERHLGEGVMAIQRLAVSRGRQWYGIKTADFPMKRAVDEANR